MKLKFLQQGDYVKNLTRKQFEELIEIENNTKGCLSYIYNGSRALFFSRGILLHGIGTTELTFEQFKQRLINTIQNAN